jgi:hypothetical protein
MTTIPANPQPLAERIERLEREYRTLANRVQRLERRAGSCLLELVRTTFLLVVAGLLLHLLGFAPPNLRLERLPVVAKDVDAESVQAGRVRVHELLLQDDSGTVRARLSMDKSEPGLTFLDDRGRTTVEVPPRAKER